MKSSTDRQTDRTEQLLISRFSGSHPFGLLLKNGYHFEDIFEVILLFENRGHTSVAVKLRPKQKWLPFSQIIKTPNWLALTPLEYTLPYHLKQILFCGLLYKKLRVVILLLAFSNSFPSWKLRHCDCELTLRPKQNGHCLQMEFPNSCLFVWKLLFFDYKFTIRSKQNGHHFMENTLHIHFLVWTLVWFG